jgi:hypothetical protein
MTVDLVMRVARDGRERLIGTLRLARGTEDRGFSGTLELMRALEELVPADEPAGGPAASRATTYPPFERGRG